jgi:hypothetical protein
MGCASDDRPAETGSQAGTAPGGFLIGDDGLMTGGGGAGAPQGPQCLGETREAEAIGLDMYVMLDISGSMLDQLPQESLLQAPATKWDAVRRSLESFVQAPETADIGIGLQYFPQVREGVPFSCTTNAECGGGGPCTNSVCVVDASLNVGGDNVPAFQFVRAAGNTPRFCIDDADCPGNGESCRTMVGECVIPAGLSDANPDGAFLNVSADPTTSLVSPLCSDAGDCQGLPETACEQVGVCSNQLVVCSATIACPPGAGTCEPFPYTCLNQTSCDVAEYSAPAVPIASGPAHSLDVVQSLQRQTPAGLTPTGPALNGALEHARLWAGQNAGRQVVTVLATDGFPTECTPVEIPEIALIARQASFGERPVRTFVIGVFGAADLGSDGQERLDALARAGGTERAILVNTGGNVTEDFLDALNLIRDTTVSCEFQLDSGAELDFDRVNLQMTDAVGNSTALFNVGDISACGADDQGWYYVRDAAGVPSQINVCPVTCAAFMGEGIRADLQIGCATRIR